MYIGKINNWNQVGGPNLPIKPYLRSIHNGSTVELCSIKPDYPEESVDGGQTEQSK